MSENETHELGYMAGTQGILTRDTAPHWYCTCGRWVIYRDHKGSPFEATAKRRHRQHVRELAGAE